MIAGRRTRPLAWALTVSVVTLVTWIGVFGTYVDVLGAATVIGWPAGGILGALVGSRIKSRE